MTMSNSIKIDTWVEESILLHHQLRIYVAEGSGELFDQFQEWMIGRPVINRRLYKNYDAKAPGYARWAFARKEDDALFKMFWGDYTEDHTLPDK
jgi:hypothetical protein